MITPKVIYIIDDGPDDQALLIRALKKIDAAIECFTADNGQEGLLKLENGTISFPNLIFLDLNMPRINGKKVLFELKNNPLFNFIPVVIYTTSSSQKDKDDAKLLGASDYLVKQIDPSDLKSMLTGILSTFMP